MDMICNLVTFSQPTIIILEIRHCESGTLLSAALGFKAPQILIRGSVCQWLSMTCPCNTLYHQSFRSKVWHSKSQCKLIWTQKIDCDWLQTHLWRSIALLLAQKTIHSSWRQQVKIDYVYATHIRDISMMQSVGRVAPSIPHRAL